MFAEHMEHFSIITQGEGEGEGEEENDKNNVDIVRGNNITTQQC